MKIVDLNSAVKVPFNLDGRIMYHSEKIQLIHLSMEPGQELEKHSNPFDVIFYVLEGEGVLHIDGDEFLLSNDQTIEVKRDRQRGWTNRSNNILKILVIKVLN